MNVKSIVFWLVSIHPFVWAIAMSLLLKRLNSERQALVWEKVQELVADASGL